MKTKEIIQKTDKELMSLIGTTRTDIAKAHVDLRTTQQANVKQIGNLKTQLARALTIARQREISQELAVEDKGIPEDKVKKAKAEKKS